MACALSVVAWIGLGFTTAQAQSISAPPVNWISQDGRNHPLAGKIYRLDANAASATQIEPQDFIAQLSAAPIIGLGEIHDNADHHIWQAWIVRETIAERKRNALSMQRGAIVFEQIRTDQQAGLDAFARYQTSAARIATVADLKKFLDWEQSGWDNKIYDPLLDAAILSGAVVMAGDVPRATIRKVAREGQSALSDDERTRLHLDRPLEDKLNEASLSEIETAHCGVMPKSAFGGMAYAQRYRDASLADAVIRGVDAHGVAILIAGTGHVRSDRGVPWYIRQSDTNKAMISVMMVEVEDGNAEPASYAPRDPGGRPAADYLILTPRTVRPDPCETMRAKMPSTKP
ncbi:MAG: hypothetical protein CTY31_07520 [Hyphomicrobium sp.]|nr:MAG: hypothetical protein CTY39_08240 [Hyphomicrobium sp.]PPC99751.1 MAG: hypothetical protein CTY31_07520 [Hyphomicrobium sp.]